MFTGPNAIKRGTKRKTVTQSPSTPNKKRKTTIVISDDEDDKKSPTVPTLANNMSGFQRRRTAQVISAPGSSAAAATNGTLKKKVLKIKPFAIQPTLPPTFEEDTWAKLKRAVVSIFKLEGFNTSQEELYKVRTTLIF
jgi:hypothetical protein